jgi:hypothetical protein
MPEKIDEVGRFSRMVDFILAARIIVHPAFLPKA